LVSPLFLFLNQLLLFDGFVNSEPGYLQFSAIEKNIEEDYKELIDVYIIVPALVIPKMPKFKSLLLDAERELNNIYGASSECLYLIRPDGYIAFRSQPASWDELCHYLTGLFKGNYSQIWSDSDEQCKEDCLAILQF